MATLPGNTGRGCNGRTRADFSSTTMGSRLTTSSKPVNAIISPGSATCVEEFSSDEIIFGNDIPILSSKSIFKTPIPSARGERQTLRKAALRLETFQILLSSNFCVVRNLLQPERFLLRALFFLNLQRLAQRNFRVRIYAFAINH